MPAKNATVQWGQLGQLLNAAILGIHDATPESPPQIIVHIDRGGDWAGTQWFFDNLILTQDVQFDMIGETYYPFWQGTLKDLSNCLANTALSYGKRVVVAETSFPWTNSYWTTNLDGLPGAADAQAEYATALAQLVWNVPSGLGAGVFWWGAEYQAVPGLNEAGFNTTSWFDEQGNLLPAAGVWGRMVAPLLLAGSPGGAGVAFHWPLSGTGTTLWSATNLSSPPGWSPVTIPVQFDGTNFNATVAATGAAGRFFRLEGH